MGFIHDHELHPFLNSLMRIDGNYNYTHEIPATEFGHKHNPMAMYDENPLGVLSN